MSRLCSLLLLPLALLLQLVAGIRRKRLQEQACELPVPVVVVGNITVGGAGKTPVVLALATALLKQGYKPGIISRGYGSEAAAYPYIVKPDSPVAESGDEALMMAQSVDCPVVIHKDRLAAARHLLQQHPQTEVIISDDGLQHYRLPRDYEIIVVDGERGLGNGYCLPAGPLREAAGRLRQADFLLANGKLRQPLAGVEVKSYRLHPESWRPLSGSQQPQPAEKPCFTADITTTLPKAVAAIGHPERFFKTLAGLGIDSENVAFDDHHVYSPDDLHQWQNKVVLMTQKDAVKCRAFAGENWWWLKVEALLPDDLLMAVIKLLPKHQSPNTPDP